MVAVGDFDAAADRQASVGGQACSAAFQVGFGCAAGGQVDVDVVAGAGLPVPDVGDGDVDAADPVNPLGPAATDLSPAGQHHRTTGVLAGRAGVVGERCGDPERDHLDGQGDQGVALERGDDQGPGEPAARAGPAAHPVDQGGRGGVAVGAHQGSAQRADGGRGHAPDGAQVHGVTDGGGGGQPQSRLNGRRDRAAGDQGPVHGLGVALAPGGAHRRCSFGARTVCGCQVGGGQTFQACSLVRGACSRWRSLAWTWRNSTEISSAIGTKSATCLYSWKIRSTTAGWMGYSACSRWV